MSDPNAPGSGSYSSGGHDQAGYGSGGYGGDYGAGGPPPQGPPPGPQPSRREPSNFFAALFDFGFNSFVTPMIVKVVYILATAAIALGLVFFVIGGFAGEQPALGVVALLFGWIPALLYLAFVRMTLEFYYGVVRMSQDIHRRLPQA